MLFRVANVVAWLESMADDADATSSGGSGGRLSAAPRFADHDGVWIETRLQLGSTTGEGCISPPLPSPPSFSH